MCQAHCFMNDMWLSVNVSPQLDNGQWRCELNDASGLENLNDAAGQVDYFTTVSVGNCNLVPTAFPPEKLCERGYCIWHHNFVPSVLFLDHWNTGAPCGIVIEAMEEDFWLWPPFSKNRPPKGDGKPTFRGSTLPKMEWEILHLFYLVNILSITESVQLISVYETCNLQTKFLGWWQLRMRLSGSFYWSYVQWS